MEGSGSSASHVSHYTSVCGFSVQTEQLYNSLISYSFARKKLIESAAQHTAHAVIEIKINEAISKQ